MPSMREFIVDFTCDIGGIGWFFVVVGLIFLILILMDNASKPVAERHWPPLMGQNADGEGGAMVRGALADS